MSAAAKGPLPALRPCEYKVGKVLGEGTYATVKEAIHIKTGKVYAAKIFNKRLIAAREKMIINEIKILQTVSTGHDNLLHLVDFFESQNNLYVITELAKGGELFYWICDKGHYTEADAVDIVKVLCDTVRYLHEKGIVHRDLKPENLLFRTQSDDPKSLVIADFGLARCLESKQHPFLTTTCGTPGYMAPEILQRRTYGKPVDIWAIGVIAFFLLSGYTPFDRNSTVSEIKAILKADYAFEPAEYWTGVSSTAKDFIRACLKLDPEERLSAEQLQNHIWLVKDENNVARDGQSNLLPLIRKSSSKRSTLKKAVNAVLITQILMKETNHKNGESETETNGNAMEAELAAVTSNGDSTDIPQPVQEEVMEVV